MRWPAVTVAIVVGSGAAAWAAPPSATARTIPGTVGATASRWTADGSRIVTEATIQTAGGDVVVSQLGGTVDGLTMRQFPSAAMLAPGMAVAVLAHDDVDLARAMHTVVDDVTVTSGGESYDFVRTGPTKGGKYLYWESGCIFVTYDSAGTSALPDATTFPLIEQAIATWNTDTASGSYMIVKSLGSAADEVGNDGINLIKFRDTTWCRPAVDDDPARCYNDSAAGITTATYVDDGTSKRDGAIVDADVELNNVDFAIANGGVTMSDRAGVPRRAAQNTMTHELGHLHGLEHTCLADGDPPRVDNNGQAVPECSATTDPLILDATMYNFQDCGETKKETLEADDILGITTIYPLANDPNTCAPPADISSGGCCSASGSGDSRAPIAPFALGLITWLAIARRRRA